MHLPIIVHNPNQTACMAAGDSLLVTTPVEQWAYAVELPARQDVRLAEKGRNLKLRIRVYEGSIGIGLLTPSKGEFFWETQIVAKEASELVEIPLPTDTALGSLVLRNTSAEGSSKADLEILDDELFAFSQAIALASLVGSPVFRGRSITLDSSKLRDVGQLTPIRYTNNSPPIIVHNYDQTICEATGGSLRVITPVEKWAYAVELLPRDGSPLAEKNMELKVRVCVSEGSVGLRLALTMPQGDGYFWEIQVIANEKDEDVEIPLPRGATLGSLLVRNSSDKGKSRVDLEILDDEFFAFSQAVAVADLLGHPAFRCVKLEKEYVSPGGFTTNAIGQRTALRFENNWAYPAEWREEHVDTPDLPWSWPHEEIYEWIALAEAVRGADETFTMIELGAGYGRWLVAGAQLARRSRPELKLKLVGVEAAPAHFRWMREHFEHNDLNPCEHDLIEAVVDAQAGKVYFCDSKDPSSDYGQHVESGIQDPERLIRRPVEAIGINDLLRRYEQVDLLDMDIQGHERIVVPAGIEEMSKRVRRVYIGIHEPASIATELTELFTNSGWANIASFPYLRRVQTKFGPISFTDGCQYWVNPSLKRSAT